MALWQTLIFTNTVARCRGVAKMLEAEGYSVSLLHGEMAFKNRRKEFASFKGASKTGTPAKEIMVVVSLWSFLETVGDFRFAPIWLVEAWTLTMWAMWLCTISLTRWRTTFTESAERQEQVGKRLRRSGRRFPCQAEQVELRYCFGRKISQWFGKFKRPVGRRGL